MVAGPLKDEAVSTAYGSAELGGVEVRSVQITKFVKRGKVEEKGATGGVKEEEGKSGEVPVQSDTIAEQASGSEATPLVSGSG
jgi:hypothetical protein